MMMTLLLDCPVLLDINDMFSHSHMNTSG